MDDFAHFQANSQSAPKLCMLALWIGLGSWLIILWCITSKYDGWALIGAWAAIRTNTVVIQMSVLRMRSIFFFFYIVKSISRELYVLPWWYACWILGVASACQKSPVLPTNHWLNTRQTCYLAGKPDPLVRLKIWWLYISTSIHKSSQILKTKVIPPVLFLNITNIHNVASARSTSHRFNCLFSK